MHVSYFRVLIFILKLFTDVAVFYFSGKFGRSNSVLYFTVSKPYLTVFFDSLDIIWKFRILWVFSRNKKKPSMNGGAKPLIILKTCTINTLEISLMYCYFVIFCSRCSNVLVLPPVINLRDFFWILIIRLFAFREQNIQTKEQ